MNVKHSEAKRNWGMTIAVVLLVVVIIAVAVAILLSMQISEVPLDSVLATAEAAHGG